MASFAEGFEDAIGSALLLQQLSTDAEFTCPRKSGDEIVSCAWSPYGSYFAWSLGTKYVFVLRTQSFRSFLRNNNRFDLLKQKKLGEQIDWEKKSLDCNLGVTSLAFGCRSSDIKWHEKQVAYNRLHNFPSGKLLLAVGQVNGEIKIWDFESGKIILLLNDHKTAITDLSFSPDGSLVLASSAKDGHVKFWDLMDDGNLFQTLTGYSRNIVKAIAWTPDTKRLASVGVAKMALIWNVRTGELEHKLEGHQNDVTGCCFSPDGALLFTSSLDTKVNCWDTYTGVKKATYGHMFPNPRPIFAGGFNGHEVRGLAVSSDGTHIATFCSDGLLRIWDIFNSVFPEQKVEIRDSLFVRFSSDGFILAVGCRSGTMQFYSSPMSISSLRSCCRTAIRQNISAGPLETLNLPKKLVSYLRYAEIT